MLVINKERRACPACSSSETSPYLTGRSDHVRAVARTFAYFRCARCGMRFQNVPVAVAASLYADVEDRATAIWIAKRRPLACDDEALAMLSTLARGRRLLDIGSGDGRFLNAAGRAGFEPMGVDVSERLASVARRNSGAAVLVGQLVDLPLPDHMFDVANLDQVLTYVVNPRHLMRHLTRLLRPGGIIRIREYDADSVAARSRGHRYWAYGPTHINVWTRSAIRALAEASGLSVRKIIPGTEASLRTFLRTERRRSLFRDFCNSVRHLARGISLWDQSVGADTVFYLERPARAVISA